MGITDEVEGSGGGKDITGLAFPYLSLYKDKIYSITTLNNLK
jgi:hypothetical protein